MSRRARKGFTIRVSAQIAADISRQANDLKITPRWAARELIRIAAQERLVIAMLGDSYDRRSS